MCIFIQIFIYTIQIMVRSFIHSFIHTFAFTLPENKKRENESREISRRKKSSSHSRLYFISTPFVPLTYHVMWVLGYKVNIVSRLPFGKGRREEKEKNMNYLFAFLHKP